MVHRDGGCGWTKFEVVHVSPGAVAKLGRVQSDISALAAIILASWAHLLEPHLALAL